MDNKLCASLCHLTRFKIALVVAFQERPKGAYNLKRL
jgi:hypothetical protein